MSDNGTNEVIIYEDTSGHVTLDVSLTDDTVWLTQKQMALLFDVKVPAISKHIKNILNDGELDDSTISKMETVQQEGKRKVSRSVDFLLVPNVLVGNAYSNTNNTNNCAFASGNLLLQQMQQFEKAIDNG